MSFAVRSHIPRFWGLGCDRLCGGHYSVYRDFTYAILPVDKSSDISPIVFSFAAVMVEKVSCWINSSLGISRVGLRYEHKEVSEFRKMSLSWSIKGPGWDGEENPGGAHSLGERRVRLSYNFLTISFLIWLLHFISCSLPPHQPKEFLNGCSERALFDFHYRNFSSVLETPQNCCIQVVAASV